jgi:hypothetical protein
MLAKSLIEGGPARGAEKRCFFEFTSEYVEQVPLTIVEILSIESHQMSFSITLQAPIGGRDK